MRCVAVLEVAAARLWTLLQATMSSLAHVGMKYAWTPEQTVDFMMDCLEKEDFYILCPDNEVTREIDDKTLGGK
jgi:hypothetical protein